MFLEENEINMIFEKYRSENYKINAIINDIPFVILSSSFEQNNSITEYTSFQKQNFNDNMFVNNFSLNIEGFLQGKDFLRKMFDLIDFTKKREYTYLIYQKYKKIYAPVAIENFSYTEDYTTTESLFFSMTLKEINLLETIQKNEKTITNVYNPKNSIKHLELEYIEKNGNNIIYESAENEYKNI